MRSIFLFLICCASQLSFSQQFEIIPRAGLQWVGLLTVHGPNGKPNDLTTNIPDLVVTIGADIVYKRNDFSHVLSVQQTGLGPTFRISNMYSDQGIIPSIDNVFGSSGGNVFFLGYSLQKETKKYGKFIGRTTVRAHYGLGVGAGFNRSQEVYDSSMASYCDSWQIGTSYERHCINARAGGNGFFITGKGGLNFYNKRKKELFNLQLFWHQGLAQMADFILDYEYGYTNQPQLQRRVNGVVLRSRGTVFGFTAGFPIRIIKNRPKAK